MKIFWQMLRSRFGYRPPLVPKVGMRFRRFVPKDTNPTWESEPEVNRDTIIIIRDISTDKKAVRYDWTMIDGDLMKRYKAPKECPDMNTSFLLDHYELIEESDK